MSGPTPIPPSLDTEILTVKQVATLLGVHRQTVERRINAGDLQAVKRGGRYYIRRRWYEDFLNDDPVSA